MTRTEALETLNLSQDAQRADIRRAYSKLCKIYHVETHPEEFQRIHEAYKIALSLTKNVHSEHASESMPFVAPPEDIHPISSDIPIFLHSEQQDDLFAHDLYTIDATTTSTPYDDLIDSLMENSLNPGECQEITQLCYYKYHYDFMLNADNSEEPVPDIPYTEPADDQLFLDVPWRDWKQIHWSTLFCCPEFIRKQYDYTFRNELCQLFHVTNPIEMLFDFAEKQGFRRLFYQLCQWAVNYSDNDCNPIENMTCSEQEFLDIVEKELIRYKQFANFQNHLILQWLSGLSGDLFSKSLTERIQFHKDFEETRQKCAEDFREIILDYPKTHSPFLKDYETLDSRMNSFAERYLHRNDWQKLIVCSTFFDMLTDWMKSDTGNAPCSLMPYDVWKMLRIWFEDSSTLGNHAVYWLAHRYYFPEYIKRQQAEIAWQVSNEASRHYKNIFPLPELSQGKLDLLQVIDKASDINGLADTKALIMNDLFGKVRLGVPSTQTFLTRITDGMTHFKFLLFAPKQAQNSNYGDAFCFLKDEVKLYYEQENLMCSLPHQTFYDIIANKVDYMAYQYSINSDNPAYTDEFIQTVCKNLYYYNCYAHPMVL